MKQFFVYLFACVFAFIGTQPADASSVSVHGEVECLSKAIFYEARGEPTEGQIAVALVVRARAEDSKWADTYCGVVFENGQFDGPTDPNRPAFRPTASIERIAREVYRGEYSFSDVLGGKQRDVACVRYFATPKAAKRAFRGNTYVGSIGGHAFYCP